MCYNDLCDLCTTKIGASVPSFELALTLVKPRQVNSGVKKGQDKYCQHSKHAPGQLTSGQVDKWTSGRNEHTTC